MFAHIGAAPPQASTHNPDLPSAVDDVLARALAKQPTDRFGNCTTFIQALASATGSAAPPRSSPPGHPVPTTDPTDTALPDGSCHHTDPTPAGPTDNPQSPPAHPASARHPSLCRDRRCRNALAASSDHQQRNITARDCPALPSDEHGPHCSNQRPSTGRPVCLAAARNNSPASGKSSRARQSTNSSADACSSFPSAPAQRSESTRRSSHSTEGGSMLARSNPAVCQSVDPLRVSQDVRAASCCRINIWLTSA